MPAPRWCTGEERRYEESERGHGLAGRMFRMPYVPPGYGRCHHLGLRSIFEKFAKIDRSEVIGMRAPQLSVNGDITFEVKVKFA